MYKRGFYDNNNTFRKKRFFRMRALPMIEDDFIENPSRGSFRIGIAIGDSEWGEGNSNLNGMLSYLGV